MRRLALALFLATTPVAASAFDCHTALVMGLDASRSVDQRESRLQREGLADALTSPEIVAAIAPHEGTGIAAMAFEWSDPEDQVVIARWRVLDGEAAIEAFAADVVEGPGIERRWKTGIGPALHFAVDAFADAPAICRRRIIDISGDGPGNAGNPPHRFREEGLLGGVTINGLVIRHPDNDQAQGPNRDPLIYYQREVVQGPGAFVMETASFDDYPAAIRRKLLRELAPSLALR
ncbi:MAG: DUF1194 domain-containing protein [Pseudomonadota bacterium]